MVFLRDYEVPPWFARETFAGKYEKVDLTVRGQGNIRATYDALWNLFRCFRTLSFRLIPFRFRESKLPTLVVRRVSHPFCVAGVRPTFEFSGAGRVSRPSHRCASTTETIHEGARGV